MHYVSLHRERVNPQNLAKGWHSADSGLDPYELWEMINGRFSWSPCVWKHGYRRTDNFLECSWLVLDFDDGQYTLDDAKRDWCEHTHLIATTKSHQKPKDASPACDRFRLCVPLERTITEPRELRHNLSLAIDKYGADSACKDAARFFFPCVDLVSCQYGDYVQSVVEPPEEEEREPRPITDHSLSPRAIAFLETGEAKCAHEAAKWVIYEMLRKGWKRHATLLALSAVKTHREWGNGEIERWIEYWWPKVCAERLACGYQDEIEQTNPLA